MPHAVSPLTASLGVGHSLALVEMGMSVGLSVALKSHIQQTHAKFSKTAPELLALKGQPPTKIYKLVCCAAPGWEHQKD